MPTPVGQAKQQKRKRPSDSVCRLVRRSLCRADGLVHLKSYWESPQMKFSMGRNTLELAETSMAVPGTSRRAASAAQRSLVKQIRPQYLRDVSSVEEFRSVFVHVVRCHRVVYVTTGGLHGNLTPKNLLFTCDDAGAPLGCLVDWDSSKPIFTHKESTRPATGHHEGDATFLSIERLREQPPAHLYRHDLESFMYILIWCALHLDLNGSEVPSINGAVARWTYGIWDAIQDAKLSLFCSEVRPRDRILGSITPAFIPLRRWIKGLIRMFHAGHQAKTDHNNSLDSDAEEETTDTWGEDTLNGTVTYEKFMVAIGQDSRIAEPDG